MIAGLRLAARRTPTARLERRPTVGSVCTRDKLNGFGVLHTWQTVHPHTFVHFSHRTARPALGYLFSRSVHRPPEPRIPAHSPHCPECAGSRGSIRLQRVREKRYTNFFKWLTQNCTSGAGCGKICQCISPRDRTKAASRGADTHAIRTPHTCAPSACARALSSDLTTTCTVGTIEKGDAGGLQVYVHVVRVELWISVHGVIVLYDS